MARDGSHSFVGSMSFPEIPSRAFETLNVASVLAIERNNEGIADIDRAYPFPESKHKLRRICLWVF